MRIADDLADICREYMTVRDRVSIPQAILHIEETLGQYIPQRTFERLLAECEKLTGDNVRVGRGAKGKRKPRRK